jgi:hypothetical protein
VAEGRWPDKENYEILVHIVKELADHEGIFLRLLASTMKSKGEFARDSITVLDEAGSIEPQQKCSQIFSYQTKFMTIFAEEVFHAIILDSKLRQRETRMSTDFEIYNNIIAILFSFYVWGVST